MGFIMNLYNNYFYDGYAVDIDDGYTTIFQYLCGILLREPSAVSFIDNKLYGVGKEALCCFDEAHTNTNLLHPVVGGLVADVDFFELMVHYLFRMIRRKRLALNTSLIVSLRSCDDSNSNIAIKRLAHRIRANRVRTVERSVASLFGIQGSLYDLDGIMIIHIENSYSEITILEKHKIIISETIPWAVLTINDKLIDFLENKYQLMVGKDSANYLLSQLTHKKDSKFKAGADLSISGKDTRTNMPLKRSISLAEASAAIKPSIKSVSDIINILLGKVSNNISKNIIKNGFILTGICLNNKYIGYEIKDFTKIPCNLLDAPEFSGVLGAAKFLDDIPRYEYLLHKIS